MKKHFERYPLFLVLLPAFVTIHLEKELHQVIAYRFVIDRIIIFFVVPLLLFSLFYFLNRSVKKSSLIVLCVSLPFFYFGDAKNWLSTKFPETVWQSYSFLLSIILLALVLVFYKMNKIKSDFHKLFLLINIGLILFIAADLISIAFNYNKNRYELAKEAAISNQPCINCEKPDIYYIVLDTYASSKVLQSNFNYSNKFIEEDLKNKGFFIVSNSKSNYSYTAFSLGSTLNMNYIKNVDTINKTFDREYLQALKLVYNNRLFTFLENEGYSIFNHSPFEFESSPPSIKNIDNWRFRELFDQYNIFLKMNQDLNYHLPGWIKRILGKNKYFINDPYNRKKLDSMVDQHLLESARTNSEKPKFVYAHFLKPHPPYAYDSLGSLFSQAKITDKDAYIHQIAFCNSLIKRATDSILVYSKILKTSS